MTREPLHNASDPETRTPNEMRAGRIVKGGAVRKVLWTSLGLAVVAMMVVYQLYAG